MSKKILKEARKQATKKLKDKHKKQELTNKTEET